MKIMDLLRKLGIVRYGTKSATYTSAKDMPAEFLMEDVYNAEKDLTTKEDLKAATAALKQGGGRKALYWISLVIGVLWLILFLMGTGFSAWFIVDLLLWGGFLFMAGQFAYQGRYSYLAIIALGVALLLISLLLLGGSAPPR
jgi:uncharacterized membrane protein